MIEAAEEREEMRFRFRGSVLLPRGAAPRDDDHKQRETDHGPPGDAERVVLPLQDVPHVREP